ncbi:MAG TPA: hypothetical protein VGP70_03200 [Actinomadura sp.]|nr:hypothetical protein [Actinomadura sp.]
MYNVSKPADESDGRDVVGAAPPEVLHAVTAIAVLTEMVILRSAFTRLPLNGRVPCVISHTRTVIS